MGPRTQISGFPAEKSETPLMILRCAMRRGRWWAPRGHHPRPLRADGPARETHTDCPLDMTERVFLVRANTCGVLIHARTSDALSFQVTKPCAVDAVIIISISQVRKQAWGGDVSRPGPPPVWEELDSDPGPSEPMPALLTAPCGWGRVCSQQGAGWEGRGSGLGTAVFTPPKASLSTWGPTLGPAQCWALARQLVSRIWQVSWGTRQ